LVLACADAEVSESLASVLAPDNEGAPKRLLISMDRRGRLIELKIRSGSPSTALSTALALLKDAALFEEVWLLSHAKHGRVHRA
jgi:hypothetical protein